MQQREFASKQRLALQLRQSVSCNRLSSFNLNLNPNSKTLQYFTDLNNDNLINTNHKSLAANHQANRFRQSSSPARQRLGVGGGMLSSTGKLGSTGSQLSVYGRGSKRNMLPPYRTQQASVLKPVGIGGSMQNMSPLAYKPPRRSSAVGIINGSSCPRSGSSYRSHSVDGLLDSNDQTEQRIAEAAAVVAAGSMALTQASSTSTLQPHDDYNCFGGSTNDVSEPETIVNRREKSANLPPINPQHRKSRSLDHFLDEQTIAAIKTPPSPTDETQSMQNLATPMTPEPTIRSIATNAGNTLSPRASSVRDSKSMTPDRITALKKSPSNRQSPEGISSTEDEREDTPSIKSVQSCKSAAPPVPTKTTPAKSQTRAAAHVHRGSSITSGRGGDIASGRVAKTTSSSSLGSASNAASNNNANNKTIFNRTMKKVRSLIKK